MNTWIKTCTTKQKSIRCPTCRDELDSPSTWVKGHTGIIKMFRNVKSSTIKINFLKNRIVNLKRKLNEKNQQIEELQKKLEEVEHSMEEVICLEEVEDSMEEVICLN